MFLLLKQIYKDADADDIIIVIVVGPGCVKNRPID